MEGSRGQERTELCWVSVFWAASLGWAVPQSALGGVAETHNSSTQMVHSMSDQQSGTDK